MSRKWTLDEIAQHNSANSCWVIIESKVYDVTDFLPIHPGGVRLLLNFAGRDATSAFKPFHSPTALEDSLPPHKCLGEVYYPIKKSRRKPKDAVVVAASTPIPVSVARTPSDDG